MEQYLESFNKQPLHIKALAIVGAMVLITAGVWYFSISDLDKRILGQQGEESRLQKELAEKTDQANNLNELIRDMEMLEVKLSEALAELPEGKDIDELLAQFHDIGRRVGLEIRTVEPLAERPEPSADFVRAIPVKLVVRGNYHEVALFLQEVSNLRRIVNVSNLKLDKPELRNEKVVVATEFVATAYRFAPAAEADGKKVARP
jgi:type IV pilus assembly protein PilO